MLCVAFIYLKTRGLRYVSQTIWTKTMCIVCCKEFRGWCKSFTRTEALLSLLEAVLLLVFIGLLTFLILHLIVCSKPDFRQEITPSTLTPTPALFSTPSLLPNESLIPTTENKGRPTEAAPGDDATSPKRVTLPLGVKCTWEPSHKTAATTRYYEYVAPAQGPTNKMEKVTTSRGETLAPVGADDDIPVGGEDSDGEEVGDGLESFVLALVKIRPLRESTFGCVLTVVSRYWALTAASCLEAAEEVDSLDAFVMLEGYGSATATAAHAVADVRVHPEYARVGRSRDLAALRSEDALSVGRQGLLQLPTAMDQLLTTIGERMTILGFGRFRTPETSSSDRSVRAVPVYTLPSDACAGDDAEWAPRHLARGAPMLPATGDIEPICAGALYSRGLACNYCAGTPLLRARLVLGVMAAGACGVACEPRRYVSLAAVREWLDQLRDTIIV